MKPDPEVFRNILQNAHQALQRGERHTARRWAERAVELVPDSEEAWLILAAVASPKASINYLQQALVINPNSQRALKGLQWAQDRLGREQTATPAVSALAGSTVHPVTLLQEQEPLPPSLFRPPHLQSQNASLRPGFAGLS